MLLCPVVAQLPGQHQRSLPEVRSVHVSVTGDAQHVLQGDLSVIERALPREALQEGWDAAAWQGQLDAAGSTAELRGLLGCLEEALQSGWLSPHFPRKPLLVLGAWLPTGMPCMLHTCPGQLVRSPADEGCWRTCLPGLCLRMQRIEPSGCLPGQYRQRCHAIAVRP